MVMEKGLPNPRSISVSAAGNKKVRAAILPKKQVAATEEWHFRAHSATVSCIKLFAKVINIFYIFCVQHGDYSAII